MAAPLASEGRNGWASSEATMTGIKPPDRATTKRANFATATAGDEVACQDHSAEALRGLPDL
jgi:hypothetical protein